jgi:hypothetical protein
MNDEIRDELLGGRRAVNVFDEKSMLSPVWALEWKRLSGKHRKKNDVILKHLWTTRMNIFRTNTLFSQTFLN